MCAARFILCAMICLIAGGIAAAGELRGLVVFNGAPVPGATVTATQGDKKVVAVTDAQGVYSFADLATGTWSLKIEMAGFATTTNDVSVGPNTPPPPAWELKMLGMDEIHTEAMISEFPAAASAPGTAAAASAPSAPAGTDGVKSTAGAKGAATNPAASPAGANQQANGAAAQTPQTQPGQPAKPADSESSPEEPDQRAADGFLINGSTNNGAASPFAQLAAFGNDRRRGRGLYN